jgi:hypothetical protein
MEQQTRTLTVAVIIIPVGAVVRTNVLGMLPSSIASIKTGQRPIANLARLSRNVPVIVGQAISQQLTALRNLWSIDSNDKGVRQCRAVAKKPAQ